jgi:hypothetical protein
VCLIIKGVEHQAGCIVAVTEQDWGTSSQWAWWQHAFGSSVSTLHRSVKPECAIATLDHFYCSYCGCNCRKCRDVIASVSEIPTGAIAAIKSHLRGHNLPKRWICTDRVSANYIGKSVTVMCPAARSLPRQAVPLQTTLTSRWP